MFSTKLRPMTPRPTMPSADCGCGCLLVIVLPPMHITSLLRSALRAPTPPRRGSKNSGELHLSFRRVGNSCRRYQIRHVEACHADPAVSHPIIDVEAVR